MDNDINFNFWIQKLDSIKPKTLSVGDLILFIDVRDQSIVEKQRAGKIGTILEISHGLIYIGKRLKIAMYTNSNVEILHLVHTLDVIPYEWILERRRKFMDRFKLNFGSIIRSIDNSATLELQGDTIVVGTSSSDFVEELISILPEKFEDLPIVVIDLSSEDYES